MQGPSRRSGCRDADRYDLVPAGLPATFTSRTTARTPRPLDCLGWLWRTDGLDRASPADEALAEAATAVDRAFADHAHRHVGTRSLDQLALALRAPEATAARLMREQAATHPAVASSAAALLRHIEAGQRDAAAVTSDVAADGHRRALLAIRPGRHAEAQLRARGAAIATDGALTAAARGRLSDDVARHAYRLRATGGDTTGGSR